MLKKMIGFGTATLFFICLGTAFSTEAGAVSCYSRIDNENVQEIPPFENMNFSYTLPAYNENGQKKTITFETARVLKENAFIRLKILPIRGVISWAEVQYGQLPPAVQKCYSKKK